MIQKNSPPIKKYKIDDDRVLTLSYTSDSEGDENRGWQVDQVDAYVNDDHAGYLKMSYIPEERFIRHYPTILHFVDKIKGSSILSLKENKNPNPIPIEEYSIEELKRVAKNVLFLFFMEQPRTFSDDRNELLKIIQKE
jgi:hypothetical protein